MTTSKTLTFFAGSLTAALLLAGCGTSDAGTTDETTNTASSAASSQAAEPGASGSNDGALDPAMDADALGAKLGEMKDDGKAQFGRVALTWEGDADTSTLAHRAVGVSKVRHLTSATVSPESVSAVLVNSQRASRLAQAHDALGSIASVLDEEEGADGVTLDATVDNVTLAGRGDYKEYKEFTEVFAHHPDGYRIDTDGKAVTVNFTTPEQLTRCAERAEGYAGGHTTEGVYAGGESSFVAAPGQLSGMCALASELVAADLKFAPAETALTVEGPADQVEEALAAAGVKGTVEEKDGATTVTLS